MGASRSSARSTGPDRITLGADGNLWFTEPFNNRIGRISTAGVIAEFALPTALSQPRDIVAGPDGNLWFTEFNAEQLASITPAGVVTELKRVRNGPWGIARGPGGTLSACPDDRHPGGTIQRRTLSRGRGISTYGVC